MGKYLKKLLSKYLDAIIIIFGIYSSYLYFGVLQEHIYTNPHREPFKFPEFVVFCQMFLSYIVSSLCNSQIVLKINPSHKRPLPPLKTCFSYGAAFSYSMFMTNFSLTLISYPTQALAKSCKILPAMIGSLFVKDVKYHPLQYLCVVLITSGVLIFNFDNKKKGGNDSILGISALFCSLFLDSLTSYYQETLKRVYDQSALAVQQICSSFGTVALLPMLIYNDIIVPEETVFDYLIRYPDIIQDILIFALLSAIGNYFIFWGLNLLGSVNLVIITTIRKFLTILLSILWFNHSLTSLQTFCISLVVAGAALDIYVGHKKEHKKH